MSMLIGMLRQMVIRACPRCEAKFIRRSHRIGAMETFLLRMSYIRPYRCLDCDCRFYLYDGFVPARLMQSFPQPKRSNSVQSPKMNQAG